MKERGSKTAYIVSAVIAALTLFYFACRSLSALTSIGAYSANPDSEALGNRVSSVIAGVTGNQALIYTAGAVLSAALGFLVFRMLSGRKPGPFMTLLVTEAVLYGVIFVSYGEFPNDYTDFGFSGLDLSFLNRAYLFGFGLFSCLCVRYLWERREVLEKPFSRNGFRILWTLVSLWIAFSFVGKPLFMPFGRTPWSVNPLTVTVFIMFLLWIQPFSGAVLVFLSGAAKQGGSGKQKTTLRKASFRTVIKYFAVFSVTWGLYLIACNPGNISLDAVVAWSEISETDRSRHFFLL